LLCLTYVAQGQTWSGLLAPVRATDWTHAGISGGIPSGKWTQCGPTIQAYNGSGSTIVNALNHTGVGYTSCGANTYVQLGAGTFNLTTGIRNIGVSNVELRGMGADQTHLVFTGTSTCQGGNGTCLIGFEASNGMYPAAATGGQTYNWTAGYAKGTTSITLSSGSGIVANSTMLILDQCETGYSGSPCSGSAVDNGSFFVCGDKYSTNGPTGCSVNGPDGGLARPHRFQLEAALATACSPSCGNAGPTTVTIDVPLMHPQWSSSQTPQAWLIQPSQYVGVQNLSIDASATQDTAGVSFYNVANFWSQGVAVLHSYNIGIWVEQSVHGNIQSNYVFDAGQHLAYSDPTGIKYNWSDNLIANNIVQAVRPAIMAEGPSSGNVIIANYMINSYTGDDFMFGNEWDGHSDGADYDLIEHNVMNQFAQDLIHGGHLMQTYFRNLATGWESCANGQCGSYPEKDSNNEAVSSQSFNRYMNLIYNVLGTPGYTTTYSASSSNCANHYEFNNTVYATGCGNSGGSIPIPGDLSVNPSSMRWGNWDTATRATQYNLLEVPSGLSLYVNPLPIGICTALLTCPASLYYSSRPSWWSSSIPFPAIGPDVHNGNLGQCSGTLNTPGHYSGVAALTNAQCTGTSLTASQWAGHVNAIPAMACYLNVMNGPPDGSGNALTFNAASCYGSASVTGSSGPQPPTNLNAVVK
jgi:hypothetical protein